MELSDLFKRFIRVDSSSIGWEKDGREVFQAECQLCHRTLRNSRSAKRHLQTMHATMLKDDNQTALLLLLCSAALCAAHFMHAFASRSHCLARVRLTFGLGARRVIFLSCALSLSCRELHF